MYCVAWPTFSLYKIFFNEMKNISIENEIIHKHKYVADRYQE